MGGRYPSAQGIRRATRCSVGLALEKCRRHNSRSDQCTRTADGLGNRQSALWPNQQPMGFGADTGRFQWREAAAIAAGMSAGGVGSDGGGSIRVPAHFSGICGLKPTPGRIPATGHFPESAGPFAAIGVVGPMTRTVADLKLFFEVMQGPDIGDTNAAPVPIRWPSESEARKLRIGYFEEDGRTPSLRKLARSCALRQKPCGPPDLTLNPFSRRGWKQRGSCGGNIL